VCVCVRSATLQDVGGRVFTVTKGAPPVVLKLAHNYMEIREPIERAIDDFAERGVRCIAVAVTDQEKRWHFAGLITFLDPPRPDTKQTIEDANKLGVGVKMITGDQLAIARETCRMLGMGTSCFGANALPPTAESADAESLRAMDNIEVADGFAVLSTPRPPQTPPSLCRAVPAVLCWRCCAVPCCAVPAVLCCAGCAVPAVLCCAGCAVPAVLCCVGCAVPAVLCRPPLLPA
jgi:hypothetical protein